MTATSRHGLFYEEPLEERFIDPPKIIEKPLTYPGFVQTFAMYVRPYCRDKFQACNPKRIVKIKRIGGLVSLVGLHDPGRLSWTIGWGNGRASWIGVKGLKWEQFYTWGGFRERVHKRDHYQCVVCHKVVFNSSEYVCDHIVPLCKDGKDWYEDPEMSNFQTLCLDCNRKKTKADMDSHRANKRLEKSVGKNGFTLLEFASSHAHQTEI